MGEEKQPDWKYTLIVSQYYYSRHSFIVRFEPDFLDRAKKFVEELISYKRNSEKDYSHSDETFGKLGDLSYAKSDKVRHRYNINDAGDIYFMNYEYANRAMCEAVEYAITSERESKGYKRKQIQDDISNHHSYRAVCEIVQKYFEIA